MLTRRISQQVLLDAIKATNQHGYIHLISDISDKAVIITSLCLYNKHISDCNLHKLIFSFLTFNQNYCTVYSDNLQDASIKLFKQMIKFKIDIISNIMMSFKVKNNTTKQITYHIGHCRRGYDKKRHCAKYNVHVNECNQF